VWFITSRSLLHTTHYLLIILLLSGQPCCEYYDLQYKSQSWFTNYDVRAQKTQQGGNGQCGKIKNVQILCHLTPGGIAMDGLVFRQLLDKEICTCPLYQQGPFLSPYLSPPTGRLSLDVPHSLSPSPTFVSSYESSSVGGPPSPTLSTQSSVQFATSLHLRNNKPDEWSGLTSLDLLSPSILDTHRRKRSVITLNPNEGHSSLDETEPDHSDGDTALHRAKSDATSLTIASPSAYFKSHSCKFMHSDSEDNVHTTLHPSVNIQLESRGSSAPDKGHASGSTDAMPLDEDDIDLGLFAFKPYKLASLLDPKDLHSLKAIGGVEALLHGLGTHPTQGLWVSTHDYGDDHSSDSRPGAGAGASQRHDRPLGN